jgi:hypothetical protein
MKHLLNNLTESEKESILKQHTGGMKVVNERFNRLIESKMGDVKPLINEQADCSKLVKMESGMNPGTGSMANGFKPEKDTWENDLTKVVKHTNMYKFNGDSLEALKSSSSCMPAKNSIDYVTFVKGNEKITYLGID